MPTRICEKCGTEGYENQMFIFYSFKCKKCGFEDSNLETHPLRNSKMTLKEYYGLPDDV